MLDRFESRLARAIGRDRWPYVEGVLESEITVIGSMVQREPISSSFLFISYEVNGSPYTAVVRNLFRKAKLIGIQPSATKIQYNPQHPETFYYAPAQRLAHNVIAVVSLLVGISVVVWIIASA